MKPAKSTDRHSCRETRRDGSPCTAKAGVDGYCVGHRPGASEARAKGGRNSATAARLEKLVPPRLVGLYDRLEAALDEVHGGALDPRVASAMASLAGAMVRVLTSGELEDRVRKLEERSES